MSKERLGNRDRASIPRWLARITGATALAASLLVPSTHAVGTAAVEFNPGIILETPEPELQPIVVIEQPPPPPVQQGILTRDTGIDMEACRKYIVCGTDLGIPFLLPNGSVGYLLGDTFAVAGPHIPNLPPGYDRWRSPVMLRSNQMPKPGQPIQFDSAAGLAGEGLAPEFMHNKHRSDGEISVLPNDAVSLPNGDIVVSYMSIGEGMTQDNPHWQTNYAGLAISHDGNNFERIPVEAGAPVWMNTPDNLDPNQMWSMQLDGDYVYIVTVRSGRQMGPMQMLRVPWQQILDKGSYECWNGKGWGGECKSILPEAQYGEPSLRKLADGKWAVSYADFRYTHIVTHTANSPTGPWSAPKIQLTWRQLNALYGGFIHPYSTEEDAALMVSTWQAKIHDPETEDDDELLRYDINHLNGSL